MSYRAPSSQNNQLFSLNAYLAASNQATMALHYWLAYSAAWLKPYVISQEPMLKQPDSWLVQRTQSECRRYLKLPGFADSLADYIGALMKTPLVTKVVPINRVDGTADPISKYLREALGDAIESQETPHEIAWRKDGVRLLHYHAAGAVLRNTPLLVVYAPINRYHIMDIRPGRSIIEHFVQAGFDVFLLDWGPQANNRPTMSDYLAYLQSSIEYIKKTTGAQKVSLLGYSWGGVLSAIYASLPPGQENIKNLVLQSAHVDFDKDDSILASWFRRLPIDDIVQKFDTIDTSFINLALVMRNPIVHFRDATRFSLEMGELPGWFNGQQFWADTLRILSWLGHTSDMPSVLFAAYIRNLYQQNQLVGKSLEIKMARADGSYSSTPSIVDLYNISMPLLNIVGELDDICPPSASLPIMEIASSMDKKIIKFPVGHIELCTSAHAHSRLWPQVVNWLQSRDLQRA